MSCLVLLRLSGFSSWFVLLPVVIVVAGRAVVDFLSLFSGYRSAGSRFGLLLLIFHLATAVFSSVVFLFTVVIF